jgi:hypothetical protein
VDIRQDLDLIAAHFRDVTEENEDDEDEYE